MSDPTQGNSRQRHEARKDRMRAVMGASAAPASHAAPKVRPEGMMDKGKRVIHEAMESVKESVNEAQNEYNQAKEGVSKIKRAITGGY